jgi:hypothetical protein
MSNKEIWIPSKLWIRDELFEDFKVTLRVSSIKRHDFMRWIKDNAAVLNYIGDEMQQSIIDDVISEFDLVLNANGDYVKKGQSE